MKTIPFYVLLLVLLSQAVYTAPTCTICSKCTSCGPDVLSDGYLDDIDALMQAKVQNLGFPQTIGRNVTRAAIIYSIQYSSGLLIVLQLSLTNMQIQLLSYSINSSAAVPSVPSATATTKTYETTSDGYFIMENFNSSKQVNEIMTYLQSVINKNLSNFQLVGVQFSNASALLYRLFLKVLSVSSGITSVTQTVLVQYIGTNNCLLIDSNYTNLNETLNWIAIDNKAILSDTFISAINTLLISKYGNMLGKSPTIVSLALALPYYQVVYQVDSSNYSFIILYDYFQNRILQGNLTTSKSVTTFTQATSNAPNNQNIQTQTQTTSTTIQSEASSSSISAVQSGSTSSSNTKIITTNDNSINVGEPVVSESATVVDPQTYNTVTTASTASSDSASQAQTNSPTTTNNPNVALSSTTVAANSNIDPSTSSSTTATSNSGSINTNSQSSQTQSSSVSPILTSYQLIANFQYDSEFASALKYLVQTGQNISMSQVQSVQKMVNGTTTRYLITIQLNNLGSVVISSAIFYQYVLQIDENGNYQVVQSSYTGLNSPDFVALSLQELKKDENIKIIARYLLSQQFPMLSSNSQLLVVYRDIPYYQIIFKGSGNTQLTFIILYGFNGSVQVISATSMQVSSQKTSNQSSTQTTINGQTISSTSTLTSQSGQSQTVTQSTNTQTNQQNKSVPSSTASTSQTAQNNHINQTAQTTQNPTSSIQTIPSITSQSQQSQMTQTQQNSQESQNSQNAQISQSNQVIQSNTNSQSTQNAVQPISQQAIQTQTQSNQTQQATNTQNSAQSQSNTPGNQLLEPVFVQIKQVQSTSTPQATTNQETTNQETTNQETTNQETITQETITQEITNQQTPNQETTNQAAKSSSSSTSSQSSSSSQGSSSTSTTSNDSNITNSLNGFNHFGTRNDQFYSYVIQGQNQINQTLISKGYSLSEIIYKDIVYKLDRNVLTILFKVQSGGLVFKYQYKGNLGSSYQLTTPSQPSAIQTSSDTQNYASNSNTFVQAGVAYQQAQASFKSQSYIQSYLDFLASSDICYSRSNLVGIFVDPNSLKSILFRFKNATQFYNIVTNNKDINRILNIYLSDHTQQSSQETQAQVSVKNSLQSSSNQNFQINSQVNIQTQAQSAQIQSAQEQATNNQTTETELYQTKAQNVQPNQNSQYSDFIQAPKATQTIQNIQNSQNTQVGQNTQSAQTPSTQQSTIFQSTQSTQSQTKASQTVQKIQKVETAPIKSSLVVTIANVDPKCLCYDKNRCLKCAHRYYLNNNKCIQVPNQCLSYDIYTGACVKCLPGYSLLDELCQLDDVTAYYYENKCFQCLGDYRLVNRRCVYAPVSDPKSKHYLQTKNPLCLSWNNGKCNQCLPGTYLSSRKVCELVDPFCTIFDYAKDICRTCNEGYKLKQGKCVTV